MFNSAVALVFYSAVRWRWILVGWCPHRLLFWRSLLLMGGVEFFLGGVQFCCCSGVHFCCWVARNSLRVVFNYVVVLVFESVVERRRFQVG